MADYLAGGKVKELAPGAGEELEAVENDIRICFALVGIIGGIGPRVKLDGINGGLAQCPGGGPDGAGNNELAAASAEVHRGDTMGARVADVLAVDVAGLEAYL